MDREDDCRLLVPAAAAADRNQPQQKTQPRSILTEEEYNDTLTHIVTRDYFPSIPSLRRDNAILEARRQGDIATAVAVRRVARKEETEREREWHENLQEEEEAAVGTTALTHHNGNRPTNVRKRPRPLKHETVTGFHARVTSEDNAEFEMNQERERRELEATLSIVYSATANNTGRLLIENALNKRGEDGDNENTHKRRSLLSDTPLGLASDKYNASPSGIRITGKNNFNDCTLGISKNGLFFEPPQHHKQDATYAKKSDNLLMPPPPKRVSNQTRSSIIPSQQSKDQPPTKDASSKQLHELVEYIPKSTEPNINPPATRFPYQNDSRLLPNNNRRSNIPDIRRSNSHMSDTSASELTDLDASPRSLAKERAAYQKAKVRENETFVAMTPIIRPGGSGVRSKGEIGVEEEEEPIMTWGNVASTPQVLGGGSSADGYNNSADWEPSPLLAIDAGDPALAVRPTFDVVDKSSREVMAQNAEKILLDRTKKYRAAGSTERKKWAGYAPKSKSSSGNPLDRSTSLTPAARALLQASNCNPSSSIFQSSTTTSASRNGSRRSNARSKDSFGSALRMTYTPALDGSKRRHSSTSAMLRAAAAAAAGATPRIHKPGCYEDDKKTR